jgi:hypothetical protein
MAKQDTDKEKQASEESFDLQQYDRNPPAVLYRYCAFNEYAESIFLENKIYFCAPKDFNDPFDSMILSTYATSKQQRKRFLREGMSLSFPNLPQRIINEKVRRTLTTGHDIPIMQGMCDDVGNGPREKYGVFCMAEENDSIIMWAHYAGHHTGFCLEFRSDHPFFSRVRPVIYSRDIPSLNFIRHMRTRLPRVPLELVTKAKAWEYEREWRIVDAAGGHGLKDYPAEALIGVIFGCRMSPTNREQIKQWCEQRSLRPKLREAKKKKAEFGLDIMDIAY